MDPLLLDQTDAATRVEFGMVEAEFAQRMLWRASAELFGAIDATLAEAVTHPEVFVDEQMLRGDAAELAERAAVADLAVRLHIAEGTVRAHAHTASVLRDRLPGLWVWFLDGEISTRNATEAADLVVGLPQALWGAFQDQLLDAARALAPARFRAKARAVREGLEPATLPERHRQARGNRRVWAEADVDGMGWLNAYLPAGDIASVTANLDAIAFGLFKHSDETRTMAQLRADTLTGLLTGSAGAGAAAGAGVGVSVAVTIPALTLLGHSDHPAVLEGVGPIDIDTARRLCAKAPSITRLLTDPVTGTVLQMDPKQYRVTAALKRWLAITQVTCDFPGCGRAAKNCDLDHTIDYAGGGQTTVGNLAHRCRKHHTLKHQTRWQVTKPPGANRPVWTSPTGHSVETDPPPF